MNTDPMSHDELRAALDRLEWTQHEAAVRLGVASGASRISEWARGEREIPRYIAVSVRTRLALEDCLGGTEL